jgi:F0F1-type ATP synthase assembly protein I
MATVPQHSSANALGVGLTFAATVALFAYGGLWLDGRLGTRPWLVLAGVFLGLLGGTIHLLKSLAPGALPFGRSDGRGDQGPTKPPT